MAGLNDILTALQNGVQAVNAYTNSLNFHAGQSMSAEIAAATVVKGSSGWCANISVVVAGSAVGYVYDSNTTASISGKRIFTIPMTVGTYTINLPTNNGIVVVPGSGQTVSLGYS